jgi:serine/threonine protein kinase
VSDIITIEAGSERPSPSSPILPAHLKKLGKYTLIYRFATGGMANIYLGKFTGPDGFQKMVAVKIIHDHLGSNPEFIGMFVDEARLVSRISHPNVVQIIELGRLGRTYFMAMEYVEGESVGALLRRTRPPLGMCARIVADAAAGLHAAHELRNSQDELYQVVHRDVSPQNILVGYNGAVKVCDFGIARARGLLRHTTKDGSLRGKFGYMAPEQASGGAVDRRADVFVLGVVLYEMTTHRKLFRAEEEADTLRKVMACEIARPSEEVSGYPAALEQVVMRALAQDPARRYQTALEFQEALERFIVGFGDPVLPSHVGQLMTEVFSDRIKKKKRILETYNDDTLEGLPAVSFEDVPEVELETAGTWLSAVSQTLGRKRTALLLGGVGVVVAGLVLALFFVFLRDGPSTAAVPGEAGVARGPAAGKTSASTDAGHPGSITISISVSPASAAIRFGGRRVSNPYEHRGAPKQGDIEVVTSAPGHQTKRFRVSLAKDSRWMVELSRREPAADTDEGRAGSDRPGKRKKKKKRKGLADDDVLTNPYQQ